MGLARKLKGNLVDSLRGRGGRLRREAAEEEEQQKHGLHSVYLSLITSPSSRETPKALAIAPF